MGSRIKKNPDKTFYWCFQASCPIARDKDPDILFQFPEEFSDEESVRSLPRFCFPYDTERVKDSVAVQHFTFVLTDLEGCQRFGFCRLTSSTQSCLCILSYLPWFEVFYKLLNNLSEYTIRGQHDEMKELLSVLYKHPVPPSSGSITLQMGGKLVIGRESPGYTPKGAESERIPYFIAPDPKALASIPESRNLTELVVAVDVGNLLKLFASLLFERRVLIYCSKLSTLTACVHACNVLLFPMYWQHIFIPVLPPHLLDYCCAPMPYLIGIHSSLLEPVRSRALEDVVMLNVDTNTVDSPYDDLKKIPAEVVEGLKVRLKRQTAQAGTGVTRVFLWAQALLFGGYRDALQSPDGGPVVFCEELFIKHKSQSMREFLEDAVHLQCFKEFIDGRLEMLNCGEDPDDIFEEEVEQCRSSAGGTKFCRQWVGNLKKGGGALILTWKSTANKATKIHCKLGLKTLLSPKTGPLQRGMSVCGTPTCHLSQSDCLQNRLPITQHFGRSRPRRPARKHPSSNKALQKTSGTQDDTSVCENSFADSPKLLSASGHLQEEDQLSAEVGEMDLLGEIFETLNTQSSHEGALLYGTRSLDLFSADSMDYISHKPSQESLSPSFGHRGSLVSWEEGLEEGSRDLEGHGLLIYGMKHNETQRSMEKLGKCLQSDNENLENASLDLDGGVKMEEFRVCLENETKTKAKKAEGHIEEQLKMEDEVTHIFNEAQLQSSLDETAASTVTSDEALRLEEQNKTEESDLFPILNVTHTAGVFQFVSEQVSCVDTSSRSKNSGVPQTSQSVGPAFSKPTSELKTRSSVETGCKEQDHVCRKVSELKKMFEH